MACRRLKEDPVTARIPVLQRSQSHIDDAARVHGLESGADAYLAEPVDPSVLVATARALLRVRRAETRLRREIAHAEMVNRVSDALANVLTRDWHFQHDQGRPFAETSAELIARFPEHAELIAVWGPRFNETMAGMMPGIAELVDALDAAGVPLYAITNYSGEFWARFRGAVASHRRASILRFRRRQVPECPAFSTAWNRSRAMLSRAVNQLW